MPVNELVQEIKTKLDLIASEVNQGRKGSRNYQSITELGEEEREIVEYVADNPGVHQEGIVEYFKKSYSRIPTIKRIKRLEDGHYLIARHVPKAHKHSLFVNEDNEVLSVTKEIDGFRGAFFSLLHKIGQKINAIEKENKNVRLDSRYEKILMDIEEELKQMLIFLHYNIYEKIILTYTSRAILLWSHKIQDKQMLSNLYHVIIFKIIEIQQEVVKFEKELKRIHQRYYEFFNAYKPDHFSIGSIPYHEEICTDNDYQQEEQLFEKYRLRKEIVSVLDKLDCINYRYAKTAHFIEDINLSDQAIK